MIDNVNSIEEILNEEMNTNTKSTFPTSFTMQFRILLYRMFLQSFRNKQILLMQFFHHVISALLIGCAFYGIGNNANNALLNFKFCISVVVFFMYTHIMIPVLLFPIEFKLLRREFFNRWYGLKAFYLARTISSIPSLVIFGTMFTTITYILTYQPIEIYRYTLFIFFAILISICSEGLGIAVGSMCSITNGSIVGPASITPLLALCTYGIGYGTTIEPIMRFLMSLSYLRYGLVGFSHSLYGSERNDLYCNDDELYCHYRNPKLVLRDLGMEEQTVRGQITGLIIFIIFYRFLAYLFLRYRLTAEFSRKIFYYATKIFQHK